MHSDFKNPILKKIYDLKGFNTKTKLAKFLDISVQNLNNWENKGIGDYDKLFEK